MGTWDWDLRTNQVAWSRELEAIHGFAPGAFGSTLEAYFAHIAPEDADRVRHDLEAALQSGELRLEYRAIWPNGELHWYEARGQMARDDAGVPIALRGVCMDVTLRKQAEQALRESEQQFRTLANNIAPLAWMAEADGSIYWFNQRWYEYTGTTPDQVEGWGWTRAQHPAHIERVLRRVKSSLETGEPWEDTLYL